MVASLPRTVESRGPGYGPLANSLLPDLYLLDPSQFQQPVQYMVPQFNFPLPAGFSYLPIPSEPRNPTLAIEAPLIEENMLSLVPLAPQDPNYPSDRDGEGQWEGEYEQYEDQDPDQPDDQWPAPEDFHSTGELSDGMEVGQNSQSEPLQIQRQAPRPAEQFALERSDSRNKSENGKRRRTEDLLERQSRASPQPEVSVDQNLVQYF